jgi:glycine dehydrogenase subunit 2
MAPYLPKPRIVKTDGRFRYDFDMEKSIGRLRGFQGNFGVFVRTYAYICSLGSEGLKAASETAVLNANYMLEKGKQNERVNKYLPVAFDRTAKHEYVLSAAESKRQLDVRATDIAKRLLDLGYHPPTIYFPLLVDEALMIEPTETETMETLDGFIEALDQILEEAENDASFVQNAPYTTPVRRLDEAAAARNPVVTQDLDALA